MTVDDQYTVSFSIPQETLPWQPILVGLMHRTDLLEASCLLGFALYLVFFLILLFIWFSSSASAQRLQYVQ